MHIMKIRLADIGEGNHLDVSRVYEPSILDVEYGDLHYVEPIVLKAGVFRDHNLLHIEGMLSSRVEQLCARCLQPVHYEVTHPVKLFYDTIDQAEVDATEDLRELLVLDQNIKCLCQTNCLGLCPQCGEDRNARSCKCEG